MDKRTLVALILTAIVIVVTPMLFPPARPQRSATDTTRTLSREPPADTTARAAPSPARPHTAVVHAATAETTLVRTNRAEYTIVSPGGVPERVRLPAYRSLVSGSKTADRVELVPPGERLMSLRVMSGRDTIMLDTVSFAATHARRDGGQVVVELTSTSSAVPINLTYRFPVDSFSWSVHGVVGASTSAGERGAMLISLPTHIHSQEANVIDDTRHFAFGYKRSGRDAQSVSFRELDSAVTRIDTGAFRWVAERNKYFVIATIATSPDTAFSAVLMRGGARSGKDVIAAHGAAVLPFTNGTFAFRVYTGPQSWENLRASAPDLENVNPYGTWLHAVVQPFATIMMRLLLWMRRTLNVEYGWVLIIFGVLVRLIFWPFNQTAMRSSIKMQRIQPQLTELQKKYRNDPERQRDAMMKLYAEHGMSPLSPLMGCLPIMLPMPILFALYFVLQNTIELRGVPFMWLPDLSARDPFFITPLFMGATMFLVSWIGMRGVPPNPQSKMMSYVMPVMFTVLFWNFASGLNLYYAVGNIASLPQQWLLAREREAKGGPAGTSTSSRGQGTGRERSRS